ncbi:MAG: antibiotic biosynthesis monooxygenase [Agarilytica sp.]
MIHVLIERRIAEDMLSTYEDASKKIIQNAYFLRGFISAENFANTDDIHHRFMICKWRSQKDWNCWYHSRERMDLMNGIAPILSEPEKILILEN